MHGIIVINAESNVQYYTPINDKTEIIYEIWEWIQPFRDNEKTGTNN